jgi:hypothetical protein
MNITAASCIVALFLLALPKPTSAQTITLETYQHPESENAPHYVPDVLGRCERWPYSVRSRGTSRRTEVCLPRNLAVTTHQADDMMLRWAKRQASNVDNTPIGLALLWTFEEAFPCSK